ncbi:MAG: DUF58 domain-containing protein, partial [Planctomycetes bacterium]|nr:DUF58 domain-containing protein [Planctomycetota bacterium]
MANGRPALDLLDPAVLLKIGPLDVVATRIVEGYLAGRHRSPFKGGCVEFAEHRPYSAGDEIRLVDWRAFARRDRYYIKQFQEETNLQAALVLDASGSMAFGASTVSKFRYAQVACACLARLLIQQGDAVGLATFDTRVRHHVPARSAAGHVRALLDALERTSPGGETSLADILHELARRFSRRGLMIIASDCFEDVDTLVRGLRHLRARGHDLLLLHVMAPEELSFAFDRWSRFKCLESGTTLDLDPAAIRRKYLGRVRAFLEQLRKGCG